MSAYRSCALAHASDDTVTFSYFRSRGGCVSHTLWMHIQRRSSSTLR